MNEEQRFAFDTWGFFTVEDALTPDQVAELKATTAERGSELYSQRQENGGFWSQAFVDLLDVPAIYFDRDPATDAFDNGLVAVAYELEDTVCNGGGFGCLTGSHKSPYNVPTAWVDMSKGVHPMVTAVPARAGTAIIFTEALAHVTLPWTAPSPHATLFYKYTKQGVAWSQANYFFQPSDANDWHGVDDRKRAILTPPPQSYVDRKAELAKKEA